MTFLEMAKIAMPGASDDEADYALWNHTPFPFETSPRILFKKLRGYQMPTHWRELGPAPAVR
jgi:hypothetical protein